MSIVLMDEETERRLLANDPSLTLLCWNDRRIVTTLADCERAALALGQSTYVESLSLSLHIFDPIVERVLNGEIPGGLSDTAVGKIAVWMKSTPSLRNLHLISTGPSQRSSFHVLPHFLSSIRMSRRSDQLGVDSIAMLCIGSVHIKADDLVMLIQDAQLKVLSLGNLTILKASFSTKQEALHQVVQSIASDSSLATLALDVHDADEDFIVGILTALRTNKSIRKLELRDNTTTDQLPLPILNAILEYFCAATCPTKSATFDSFRWKGEIMTALVQALKASPMPLKELQLRGGSIDASSCAILQAVFESVCSIDCLCLGQVKFPKRHNYQALCDLIGKSPGLKTVRMRSFDIQPRRQTKQFQAIMRGFTSASCTVDKVSFRKLSSRHLHHLIDAIPYLRSVKSMTIGDPTGETNGTAFKKKILTAFRRNRSVLKSKIVWNVLDQSDRARLQTYHDRNTHLGRLLRLISGDERTWDEHGGALLPSLLGASVSSGSPVQCLRDILGSLVAAKDLLGAAPHATANKRQADESPGRSSAKRCKV